MVQLFFYHDLNNNDVRKAKKIIEYLESNLACSIKRRYKDLLIGRMKDLIANEICRNQVTIALLTSTWQSGDWNRYIADILDENHDIKPKNIILALDGIEEQKLGKDYVKFENIVEKDAEKDQDVFYRDILKKLAMITNLK